MGFPNNTVEHLVMVVGAAGVGKSRLSRELSRYYGFEVLSTREQMLALRPSLEASFNQAQLAPDEEAIAAFKAFGEARPLMRRYLIDSPRTAEQVRWLSKNHRQARVITIHMEATLETVKLRLEQAAKARALDPTRADRPQREDDVHIEYRYQQYLEYFEKMKSTLMVCSDFNHVDCGGEWESVWPVVEMICKRRGVSRVAQPEPQLVEN